MKHYFIFKGKKNTDFGLEIASFGQITKPSRSFTKVEVAGRNGNILIDKGTYSSYSITLELAINTLVQNRQKIDEINEWLDGSGELILSTEPDKIYTATVFNQYNYSNLTEIFLPFNVSFEVQPLKKSVNYNDEFLEIDKPTAILNIGTVESQPVITVFGNGEITLIVNAEAFILNNVEGKITVDSQLLEVYKDDINENSKYNNFAFPKFKKGKNSIDFRGNVEKIQIVPNWRWI